MMEIDLPQFGLLQWITMDDNRRRNDYDYYYIVLPCFQKYNKVFM
jgi:hypothetical protein